MIQSMTGFGSAQVATSLGNIHIEIRSLNSKQLDLTVRLPKAFSALENEVRPLIAQKAQRGKMALFVNLESENNVEVGFNRILAESYLAKLSSFASDHQLSQDNILEIISRLPDVFGGGVVPSDEDQKLVVRAISDACDQLNVFRLKEGTQTGEALSLSVQKIEDGLRHISILDEERIHQMKERFENWVRDRMEHAAFDTERFEQELIFYLEKLDVSEEKQRLAQHLNFFHQTMQENDANGRKLGFIAQEMGREINTLGSKANHFGMQQWVVEMKNELEKIKEQVLNVL
jgi:uncharacterized protein (TIGR00255 family)